MTAELFTMVKSLSPTGQKSYTFYGKDYEELLTEIPGFPERIMKARIQLGGSVSSDYNEALEQFIKFREEHYARDKLTELVQDPDEVFLEKMMLLEFSKVLTDTLVEKSFLFLRTETPYNWLSTKYSLYYTAVKFVFEHYYRHFNNLRYSKKIPVKDYCGNLVQSFNDDPGWKTGNAKQAYDLVFHCYDSFPFSRDAANEAFDLTISMLDFYVFTNYTSEGKGAKSFLRAVKEQMNEFDSNFRFHRFLVNTMGILNDAHITYRTDCYEQFIFVQPLVIQHIDFQGSVIIGSSYPEYEQWINAQIIAIDGNNATWILLANTIGQSHQTRVRYILPNSKKYWDSFSQDFKTDRGNLLKRITPPDRPYMVYTVLKPGTNYAYEFKVDWLVFKANTMAPFDDKYSYWKENCAAPCVKKKLKTQLQKRTILKPKPDRNELEELKRRVNEETFKATSEGTTPVVIGPGFAFFILNDQTEGDYAVLVIQTFDVTDLEAWFTNMRKGFLRLINQRVKKLLLDLTGNTGGVLCLAYTLLGILSPSEVLPFPATKFQYGTRTVPSDSLISFSKCTDEAGIKMSPFRITAFNNLTCSCPFNDNASWLSEGDKNLKIAAGFVGGYSRFSPILQDNCLMKYTPLLADVKPGFSNIILHTDGLCGSSCAVVALYLHQNGYPGIATMTHGVGDGYVADISLFSFAGGQVINSNNVMDVAKRSSCFDLVPKALERIKITMTFRGLFNLNDLKNPLEYTLIPANASIGYTAQTMNFWSRWKRVFTLGMDVVRNPENYLKDYSDIVTVGGVIG